MTRRKVWLSVDPGIATGWALLDDAGAVMATSVWGTAELKVSLDKIVRAAFTAGYDVYAVVEKMPAAGGVGPLAQKMELVRRDVLSVLEGTYDVPVTFVLPGAWKQSRVARQMAVIKKWQGAPVTVHQQDAIRMGRYAMDRAGALSWPEQAAEHGRAE